MLTSYIYESSNEPRAAYVRASDNYYWNFDGSAWEAYNGANFDDYLQTPTQVGLASTEWAFTPLAAMGAHTMRLRIWNTTSPTNTLIADGRTQFDWNGQYIVDAGGARFANIRVGPAFKLAVSDRGDGTHIAYPPLKVRPGVASDLPFSIDMAPLFGPELVTDVGAGVVPSGSALVAGVGGKLTEAVLRLGGTVTANERTEIKVPVTLEESGPVEVSFELYGLAD